MFGLCLKSKEECSVKYLHHQDECISTETTTSNDCTCIPKDFVEHVESQKAAHSGCRFGQPDGMEDYITDCECDHDKNCPANED